MHLFLSRQRIPWLLLLLLALFPAPFARADERPRAVLLLLSGVPSEPFLREWSEPRWDRLRERSAVGLMNAAVRGPATVEAACLTVGTGTRVAARAKMPVAGLSTVPQAELFRRMRGGPSRGEDLPDGVRRGYGVHPMLRAWLRASRPNDPLSLSLGTRCREAGIRVAYLGALDKGTWPVSGTFHGPGYLCAADDEGSVPIAGGPGGSGVEAWHDSARDLLGAAPLLVIDLPSAVPVPDALDLASRLVSNLDPARDILLITSPAPGQPVDGAWKLLSPVVAWGSGWGGQTLTSTTTRTPGLIANIDVAPTLAGHLGVRAGAEGHPIRPAAGTLQGLQSLAAHARVTRKLMVPVLLGWAGLALLAVLLASLVLLVRGASALAWTARGLIALTAAFVAAMLLSAAVPVSSEADLLLRVVTLTLLIGGGAVWLGRKGSPFMLIVLFGTALVLGDLLTGGRMLARNLMSDFVNIGARFYGIGNEYLGILLCVAVLTPFWIDRNRGSKETLTRAGWTVAGVLWPLSLVAAGAPSLGADFGGAVALSLTFLAAGCLGLGARPRKRYVFLGLLAVAAVAGLLVFADLSRPPGERTHVGELAARALAGGPDAVAQVVFRKIGLNLEFAFSSAVLGGVAIMTPVLWLWYHRLGRRAWDVLSTVPKVRAGVLSILAGGIVAGLLNDTGVVAWAMATCCAILLWLDLLIADCGFPNPQSAIRNPR